jgi:hypothetical protein
MSKAQKVGHKKRTTSVEQCIEKFEFYKILAILKNSIIIAYIYKSHI